jgi:hypothetical protein
MKPCVSLRCPFRAFWFLIKNGGAIVNRSHRAEIEPQKIESPMSNFEGGVRGREFLKFIEFVELG